MGCAQSTIKLEEEKIQKALTDALSHAAQRAIDQVGKDGGFSANPDIHIGLPGKIGDFLNKVKELPGLGDSVDDFEKTMNQAAETAAGDAIGIFTTAVEKLNFKEVRNIFEGADNAATEFFRAATSDLLMADFKPVIREKLARFGCVSLFEKMAEAYGKLPFCTAPEFDVETYVAEEALNGLFHVLAQKEEEIRNNPKAREASKVMEEVFGHPDCGKSKKKAN